MVLTFQRWPGLAVTCVLAVSLLGLAVPRTMEAIAQLPGNPVLDAMQNGKITSLADIQRLEASRSGALAWNDTGRNHTDKAFALLAFAEAKGTSAAERKVLLAQAEQAVREGLSRSPANGYAWYRLAYILALQGKAAGQTLKALEMSFLTAPAEHNLYVPRLALAMVLRPLWPAGFEELAQNQLRLAWQAPEQRWGLVRQAVALGYIEKLQAVVETDFTDTLPRFLHMLKSIHKTAA